MFSGLGAGLGQAVGGKYAPFVYMPEVQGKPGPWSVHRNYERMEFVLRNQQGDCLSIPFEDEHRLATLGFRAGDIYGMRPIRQSVPDPPRRRRTFLARVNYLKEKLWERRWRRAMKILVFFGYVWAAAVLLLVTVYLWRWVLYSIIG